LLRALGTRLPADQGLSNYYVNVHRDWCWGGIENEAGVAQITRVLDAPLAGQRVLVLGAGAGRLAYDLHRRERPALTVALDFNPLLLFVAREVLEGRPVELYEFPIAPRTIEDHAVLRRLSAPAPAGEGFVLIAGDATRPPFTPGAFDVVVTPWLIDIVDEPFTTFAARVNGMLAVGGRWLNSGSLAFSQGERALRFGLEESQEIVAAAGFALTAVAEDAIPYMQSPASRHGRLERVVTWQAVKQAEVPAPPALVRLPAWLQSPHAPVPLTPALQSEALTSRIHALLLSLIDGQRSARDVARLLVEQRLMRADDAEPAVRGFLLRMHDEARKRTDFHG
jgi:SAM-dependent methyltransferase